jgi:hypothetical protein
MRGRRWRATASATVALTLVMGSIAIADTLEGDELASIRQDGSLDLGEICAGEEAVGTLNLAIRRFGGGATVYANGAVITVSPAGASDAALTAGAASGSITLPGDWVSNGGMSVAVTAPVSLNTDVLGPFTGTVTYQAVGSRNQTTPGGDLTTTDVIPVTATVVPCGDDTPPTVAVELDPETPDGNDEWYVSPVTVTLTATDAESAVESSEYRYSVDGGDFSAWAEYTAPVSFADDGVYAFEARAKSAGGTSDPISVPFKIDATDPTIDAAATPLPNAAGWNNTDVLVEFDCDDNLSGVVECPADVTVMAEGQDQLIERTVYDNAGNSATTSVTVSLDKTAPTITGAASPVANGFGWNNTDVDVDFNCTDSLSGVASCLGDTTLTEEGEGQGVVGTATDNAGNAATATVTVSIDKTDPTITDQGPTNLPNANGWYKAPVTNSFTALDPLSGLADVDQAAFIVTSGANEESEAVTIPSGTVADRAGNVASSIDGGPFRIDLTDPYDVTFVGGPANGASYVFGSVPAVPTCTAKDDLSGPETCEVSGYSSQVGEHELTATATDKAGNTATERLTYTVEAWTLVGFKSPVRMGDDVVNVMKGGRTVPLKFEIFAGETEITDTDAVSTFRVYSATCDFASQGEGNSITEADTTTGKTEFRYDFSEGQFIHNWKTPKVNQDTCYRVVMTTVDGSKIEADFRLTR